MREIENHKNKLFAGSLSGNEIMEATKNLIIWLEINYHNLDKDAMSYADSTFANMEELVKSGLERMPDSSLKRKYLRQLKLEQIDCENIIKNKLGSLEAEPDVIIEPMKEMENMATPFLQDAFNFLTDLTYYIQSDTNRLTCLSLYYSTIDEIICALHLARHHFYLQAFAHLRTVLETIDKVKVFKLHPELIEIWSSNDYKQKQKELSPSAIRKKLGVHKYDELYGVLSELGPHPSYKSFQSRTVAKQSKDKKPIVQILSGGTPLEHLMMFFYSIALIIIGMLIINIFEFGGEHLLSEERENTLEKLKTSLTEFNEQFFIIWLEENEMDGTGIKDILLKLEQDVEKIYR